jgi:unsaturated chondroitin disaccharide hydrolase
VTGCVAVAGCGGGSSASATASGLAPSAPPLSQVALIPSQTLTGGEQTSVGVPFRGPWDVSFDVRLAPATRLDAVVGRLAFSLGGAGRWRHVELTAARLWVDSRPYPALKHRGPRLAFSVSGGRAQIRALIISGVGDRAALLLHRLAELHARLAPGAFPIGADLADRLHNSSNYWTSGFWPGALWQAAALAPAGGMFARWALAATVRHFGFEHADTHDVGFMYGQSSLAAYMALCLKGRKRSRMTRARPVPARPDAERAAGARLCSRLKRSSLAAADELMRLAASNARAGTIPTNSAGPQADTIVDSMMNIVLLPWASRVTGNPAYVRLASRHAHRVAALLVRADGSTTQAVNFDRATGRVLSFATHQGISKHSTWARGEGWALYGFAVASSELRDTGLLRVAERIAAYVRRHLPAGGVPRWDYDAPAGAPVDVSAGVITAAGLLRLGAACEQLERSCPAARGWVSLSRRMLAGALDFASAQPPLGLLRGQVLNERGRGCWCDGGELMFGDTYALEAVRLERQLSQK